jgi:hypothetical protein
MLIPTLESIAEKDMVKDYLRSKGTIVLSSVVTVSKVVLISEISQYHPQFLSYVDFNYRFGKLFKFWFK